ncbi:MAG: hypothetical protein O2948_02905 [Proteobacteria bacterium]|nr:hypothetical protein [Pseudomonadota bacterium]MDA0928111.1 hypothetical protein [Pseudomonadota bacterium]
MTASRLSPEELDEIRKIRERLRLGIESFSREGLLFKLAFIFLNTYAVLFIATSTLFPDLVFLSGDLAILKDDYEQLLRARTLVALIAIIFLNIAYFFRVGFQLAILFTLVMTTYYSIDMYVMYGEFIRKTENIFVGFFFLARPLVIASLVYLLIRKSDGLFR